MKNEIKNLLLQDNPIEAIEDYINERINTIISLFVFLIGIMAIITIVIFCK